MDEEENLDVKNYLEKQSSYVIGCSDGLSLAFELAAEEINKVRTDWVNIPNLSDYSKRQLLEFEMIKNKLEWLEEKFLQCSKDPVIKEEKHGEA